MENKTKVTFENINLLKAFLQEGKFSAVIGDIRDLKVKMDTLCKDARVREKELVAEKQKEEAKKLDEVVIPVVEKPKVVEVVASSAFLPQEATQSTRQRQDLREKKKKLFSSLKCLQMLE